MKQQAFHKLEPQAFTQHAWLSDEKIVIGNEAGQVHILESGELKNTITIGTEIIGAIAGCSRGFIAGCGGTIHIYEMLEGKIFADEICDLFLRFSCNSGHIFGPLEMALK